MVRLRLAGIVAVGGEVGFAIPSICCSDAVDAKNHFQPSMTSAPNVAWLVSNAMCGQDTATIDGSVLDQVERNPLGRSGMLRSVFEKI
jgi:hypothetical protein